MGVGDFTPCPKPKARDNTKKKKKKLQTYKGRTIPPSKARGTISKKEYERAIENHGRVCAECGNPYIEMHHAKFRSQGARGQYRNLIPLCKVHHTLCHTSFEYAEKWREWLKSKYGEWYWADKYDLWINKLIPNTTDESFEAFMLAEQEKEHKNP